MSEIKEEQESPAETFEQRMERKRRIEKAQAEEEAAKLREDYLQRTGRTERFGYE